MKNSILLISSVIIAAILFSNCGDKKLRGFKKDDSGIYYNFHVQDNECENKAKKGDLISFQLRIYAEDSVLFETKEEPVLDFPLDTAPFKGDIIDGFFMMCEGDSATFAIETDSLRKYYPMYKFLDSNSYLYFDIKMLQVKTAEEITAENEKIRAIENQQLEAYLKENNIDIIPALNGIYYLEKVVGTGKNPDFGHIVTMKMALMSLEGDTLMKYIDNHFHTSIGNANIPFQWSTQLIAMKEGGKARLIFPSEAAFGATGAPEYKIQPFQPLLMDIEIITIHEEMQGFEDYIIKDFLEQEKHPGTPVSEGMYILKEEKGSGDPVKEGDTVSITYNGYFITGSMFDSSQQTGPRTVVVGQLRNEIEGWHEVLKIMNYGSTVRVLFHSDLGFGETGYDQFVAPFTPLLYEITIIDPDVK